VKLLLAFALFGAALSGADPARSAGSILDEAKAKAGPGKHAIFLTFHASW